MWRNSGDQLVIKTSSGAGKQTIQRLRMLTGPRLLELVTELPSRDKQGDPVRFRQVFVPNDARGGEKRPFRFLICCKVEL